MVTPSLVVDEMGPWQSKVLRFVASLIGLRNGYVLWINIEPSELIEFEFEKVEPTINDIVKNNAEDEMNSVITNKLIEMESGE